MSSPPELNDFLDELGRRRRRLLELVEPSGPPAVNLLEELNELSEQLIVADEELRVQQEELASTRTALLSLSEERDLLLHDVPRALLITDGRGVVVQATRLAKQLIRQPLARLAPRPIATWFEVADRGVVRSMISRITATGVPQDAEGVLVHTSDGQQVPVGVTVERVQGAVGDRVLLRWELTPTAHAEVPLRLVPGQEPASGDQLRTSFALLTAQTAVLSGCRTLEELAGAVPAAVLRLVPAADHAGLTLVGPRRHQQGTWSSEVARDLDAAQLDGQAGPLPQALAEPGLVHVDGYCGPTRSGEPGEDGRGPVSVLVVPLQRESRRVLGAITLYSAAPAALDEAAELVIGALASFVAAELERHTLHRAISTRQLIGQAVGVLVERHRMTPDAAFAVLARRSQETNVMLSSIARIVVETGQEPSEITPP